MSSKTKQKTLKDFGLGALINHLSELQARIRKLHGLPFHRRL